MSATATEPIATQSWSSTLLRRQLDTYPSTGPRYMYLAITVLGDADFAYRYSGHVENSEDSISDPAMGGLV